MIFVLNLKSSVSGVQELANVFVALFPIFLLASLRAAVQAGRIGTHRS
jgi:hypothetical protein